ncbi:hypothetical protein [Haloferax chudinovii]|uniref:DUF8070 domain-containing protein n=1 Tax=Haloferax chudinovii TaxID=1109010 RepID=A0ABD5XDN4_9EURY
MNVDALLKPVVRYTGLLGLLTVGTVYFATHSGMYMLALAGAGVLLVVLGGGAVGRMGPSNVEHAGEKGGTNRVVSNAGLWSPVETNTSLRLALLCYGAGVFLWSLVVFGVLRDTLV